MTGRTQIYELLGVPAKGLLLTDARVQLWGKELLLDCLYAPWESSESFHVLFNDCKEIHWEIYGDGSTDTTADVISIIVGADEYSKPVVIDTDIFEVTVLYRKLTIVKDWDLGPKE